MEGETNLIDYIGVILKRKMLILKIFLGVLIVITIIGLATPKTHKAKIIMEMGEFTTTVEGEKEFCPEKPIQLVEKIKNGNYKEELRENLKIDKIPSLKPSAPENTRLVIIYSEDSNRLKVKNSLEELGSIIVEEHEEKFNLQKNSLAEEIKRLKNKISSLEKEKETMEDKEKYLINVFAEEPSINNQLLLLESQGSLGKKKSEINDYYLELNQIQRQLQNSKPTAILKKPSISENDLQLNPLIIIIYLIFSLTVGIIFAFCAEWWKKEKNKN